MEIEGKIIEENDKDGSIPKLHSTKPPEVMMPMVGNYISPEDSVVPVLKKGKKIQPSVLSGMEEKNDSTKSKLTEKDRREASLPIEVFGLPLVEKMYSKSFDQREEAMKDLQTYLEKYQKKGKAHSPNDVLKAAGFLLQKALSDKVFSIYTAALNILAYCFQSFISTHQVSKTEASLLAEQSMPEIINKLGDTAPRLKNASMDYLTKDLPYSELENLQILPLYVLTPLNNNLNVRFAVGKCELVESLVKIYPPQTHSSLSLQKVMPFLVDALQHPSASVRGIAERIILFLYKQEGNKVRRLVPFDSDSTKRNIMYRRLYKAFDGIDKQRQPNTKNVVQPKNLETQDPPTQPKPSDEDLSLMKTCIFCEKKDDAFTPEGLDRHYDKDCPMLTLCSNCKQIVEIAGLTEHLLEECDAKNQYKMCPICLEAIPNLNFENHVQVRMCTMAKSSAEANHCPLCHQNIEPLESGWRHHLLGVCAFNPRNKDKRKSKKVLLKKKT